MHDRIARLMSLQQQGGASTDSSAVSEEDRVLLASMQESHSDDDDSSEDEAILNPRKLMAQIAKNTKRACQRKRPPALLPSDKPDPTPPASPSIKVPPPIPRHNSPARSSAPAAKVTSSQYRRKN